MMKTDSRIQTLLTLSCVLIGVGSTCIQPKQDNVLINLCCPTITEAEDNNTPGKFQIIPYHTTLLLNPDYSYKSLKKVSSWNIVFHRMF